MDRIRLKERSRSLFNQITFLVNATCFMSHLSNKCSLSSSYSVMLNWLQVLQLFQVLNDGDLIIIKFQLPKGSQCSQILNLLDLIPTEAQHFQLVKILKVGNPFQPLMVQIQLSLFRINYTRLFFRILTVGGSWGRGRSWWNDAQDNNLIFIVILAVVST